MLKEAAGERLEGNTGGPPTALPRVLACSLGAEALGAAAAAASGVFSRTSGMCADSVLSACSFAARPSPSGVGMVPSGKVAPPPAGAPTPGPLLPMLDAPALGADINFAPGALRPFKDDTGNLPTLASSAASGRCALFAAAVVTSVRTFVTACKGSSSATGLTGSCAVITCVLMSPPGAADAAALKAFSLSSATWARICSWRSCTTSSVSSVWKHRSGLPGLPSKLGRLLSSFTGRLAHSLLLTLDAAFIARALAVCCHGGDVSELTWTNT
mmetsp:Transcript_66820/g.159910  ORF Transcript_66820/g.159910 Transcript_66820/m.159910 type:complete len:271 (+) Transcript_66820:744-1556(+)